jgi:hypothetical protein
VAHRRIEELESQREALRVKYVNSCDERDRLYALSLKEDIELIEQNEAQRQRIEELEADNSFLQAAAQRAINIEKHRDELLADNERLRADAEGYKEMFLDEQRDSERLRAVYEAVKRAIDDEEEQNHDLEDLTPFWRDVSIALAAVDGDEDD